MRVIAIVQARTGSTRLPSKVLLPLAGKSMLQNIIERVKRAKLVDEVVVAVPGKDEERLNFAIPAYNAIFQSFEVDDTDLIARYYHCAEFNNADLIVRICADNPCVEPGEIDRAIEYWMDGPGTFVSNMHNHINDAMLYRTQNGYPDGIGCEVFAWNTLQWMHEKVAGSAFREHPHKMFHLLGIVESPKCPKEFARQDLKLDVNTREEYEYIKDIYSHFGHNEFHITEVIKYLDEKNQP